MEINVFFAARYHDRSFGTQPSGNALEKLVFIFYHKVVAFYQRRKQLGFHVGKIDGPRHHLEIGLDKV